MTRERPRQPIDLTRGLHLIKNDFELEFMGRRAKELLENLDEAIAATQKLAPKGNKRYKLGGVFGEARLRLASEWLAGQNLQEKHWEQALWDQRSTIRGEGAAGMWTEVIGFQELLRDSMRPGDKSTNSGWGEIDLLGISEFGLPVVIELKSNKRQKLLHALIEAVAYGIAIRKAWPNLAEQWRSRVAELKLNLPTPSLDRLESCPLVVAAPDYYWELQNRSSNQKHCTDQPFPDFWNPFHKLRAALAARGLPVTFLELKRSATGRLSAGKAMLPPFQET